MSESLMDLLRLKSVAKNADPAFVANIQSRIKSETQRVLDEGFANYEVAQVVCDHTNNTEEDYENRVVNIDFELKKRPPFDFTISIPL